MEINKKYDKGFVLRPASRWEIASGITWLSLGAIVSALLEVIYLSTTISLGDGISIAFPYPIAIALLFNIVLSRTARLWSDRFLIAAIPGMFWLVTYGVLAFGEVFGSHFEVDASASSLLLLVAGVAGSSFPLRSLK